MAQGSQHSVKAPTLHHSRQRKLDLSAPIALMMGMALIALAVVMGGQGGAFIDLPSLLIVMGGTATVSAACFSGRELAGALEGLKGVLLRPGDTAHGATSAMIQLVELCQKDGIRVAERTLPKLKSQPFLQRAVMMAVDEVDPIRMEEALLQEAAAIRARQRQTAAVLRRAGETAPAMGLIGTMIGLVQMLRYLDDPAQIGPAMALALLTTLYGAVLGHMILGPLAVRLERRASVLHELNMIHALGALALARQESPRQVELAINAHLAARDQSRRFMN